MKDQGDSEETIEQIEDRIARCRRVLATFLDQETTGRLRAYLQDLERTREGLRARSLEVEARQGSGLETARSPVVDARQGGGLEPEAPSEAVSDSMNGASDPSML